MMRIHDKENEVDTYWVASGGTIEELCEKVNHMLSEGWKVHGSMATTIVQPIAITQGAVISFYQPMIKDLK
jgi:hypothetical protein